METKGGKCKAWKPTPRGRLTSWFSVRQTASTEVARGGFEDSYMKDCGWVETEEASKGNEQERKRGQKKSKEGIFGCRRDLVSVVLGQ